MASKYLASLTTEEYKTLTEKLWNIQNNSCYICLDPIDLVLHTTNIDHIEPLANKGKDSEDNFALTHESCNKTKQDSDLRIARILFKLKKIQDNTFQKQGRSASLKDVLQAYGGGKYDLRFRAEDGELSYSFSEMGNNEIHRAGIHIDELSKVETSFISLPIEYVHHDDLINPRGINSSISKLIKEFNKENPQLHLSLARIDGDKIKIFDGQHKAVAQILLGAKRLLLRLFINANVDVLIETNTNAGSTLRQIAFDKSIMRQLNNTLYSEKIKQYQNDHNLGEDDLSFSEQKLIDYFKGDNANIKKYIIDNIKHSITEAPDNKLKDYLDREGKGKELPISYSAFDKTFLTFFVDSKKILSKPINYLSEEGLNPREIEISQIVQLLNILAEEIYINKFLPEVGINRIENKIVNEQDKDITDDHLAAYRMSKEEIMYNWLQYLKAVIKNYFSNTGKIYDESSLFQQKFDPQLWTNIKNFVRNLRSLPLWKDRNMAATAFAGKKNYDYWQHIFTTGQTPDGVPVLAQPINHVDLIKANNREEFD